MKTVVEQLEDAQAEIKTLQASIVTLNQAAIADVSKVETLTAQVKTLTDEKGVLVAAHADEVTAIKGELAVKVANLGDTMLALAECNKKLADPAYKMASAPGDSTAIPEGGAPAATGVSLVAQMKAIDDPVKRAEFYHANMEAIKAELK